MLVAIADTHAIVWYVMNDQRLSDGSRQIFESAAGEGNHIGVSSITFAELVYLEEKSRVQQGVLERLFNALDQPDPLLMELPINKSTIQSMQGIARSEVPDMPDRIIAATAALQDLPLISRDRRISNSHIETIW